MEELNSIDEHETSSLSINTTLFTENREETVRDEQTFTNSSIASASLPIQSKENSIVCLKSEYVTSH